MPHNAGKLSASECARLLGIVVPRWTRRSAGCAVGHGGRSGMGCVPGIRSVPHLIT